MTKSTIPTNNNNNFRSMMYRSLPTILSAALIGLVALVINLNLRVAVIDQKIDDLRSRVINLEYIIQTKVDKKQ